MLRNSKLKIKIVFVVTNQNNFK